MHKSCYKVVECRTNQAMPNVLHSKSLFFSHDFLFFSNFLSLLFHNFLWKGTNESMFICSLELVQPRNDITEKLLTRIKKSI